MAAWKGPVLLVLACLVCSTMQAVPCSQPEWREDLGTNPVLSRRGNVVLVAFLQAYCGYCRHQAALLESLKTYLAVRGFPDIEMIIINGGIQRARVNINRLINASSIPVLQDTEDNFMYSQVFGANKDDFLVYDRCGQAAVHIPHPYSNLRYDITEQLLKAVHQGRQSCHCSLDNDAQPPTDDVMVGDDPNAGQFSSSSGSRPPRRMVDIQCPPRDRRCRMYRRIVIASRNRGYDIYPLNFGRSESGRTYSLMPLGRRSRLFGRNPLINMEDYVQSEVNGENEYGTSDNRRIITRLLRNRNRNTRLGNMMHHMRRGYRHRQSRRGSYAARR